MPPVDVRQAGPADSAAIGASLGRAFADDPVFVALLPGLDEAVRARRSAGFFAEEARQKSRAATAWTTAGREGAALWAAPDEWRTGALDSLRLVWRMAVGSRLRALPGLAVLTAMDKAHPREPHWYLAVLGTDPEHQGKGIGAALLDPVLRRCDTDGLPAYLESSKASNIPFYERFGFRVTGEIALPSIDATLWPMWREPRPPEEG